MAKKSYVIAVNPQSCIGCRICETACSLYHSGECSPHKSRIRVRHREAESMVIAVPIVCQQCADPPCREVCPTGGIVDSKGPSRNRILNDECNGCGICIKSCPLGINGAIQVCENSNVAQVCDLCEGEPRCVSLCPSSSLSYQVCEEAGGNQRVVQLSASLKAMGFAV